jgi:hypothetical protein
MDLPLQRRIAMCRYRLESVSLQGVDRPRRRLRIELLATVRLELYRSEDRILQRE